MPLKQRKQRTPKRRRSRQLDDPDEADSESDPPTPPKRASPRATAQGLGGDQPSPAQNSMAAASVRGLRAEVPRLARHASSPARLFGRVEGHEDDGLGIECDEDGWGIEAALLPPFDPVTPLGSASTGVVAPQSHLSSTSATPLQPSGLALGLEEVTVDRTAWPQTSQPAVSSSELAHALSSKINLIPLPSPPLGSSSATTQPLMSPPMERASFSPYSVYSRSLWNNPSQRHSPCPTPPVTSSTAHATRPVLYADTRRHSSALTFTSSFAGLSVTPSATPPLATARSGFEFPPRGSTESLETPATRGLAASLSAHESYLQGGRRGSLPGSPTHTKTPSVSSTLSETLSHLGTSLGLHHPRASPERHDSRSPEGSPPRRRNRSGSVFSAVTQATKSTLDYAIAAIHHSPPRARERHLMPDLTELPSYEQLAGLPGWSEVRKITVQLRAVDASPDNVAATAFLNWLMNGKDQHWGAAAGNENAPPGAASPASARVASPARQPLTPRQSVQDLAGSARSPSRGRGKGGGVSGVGPKVEFAAGAPLVMVESAGWCAKFAPEGRGAVEILRQVLAGPI